MKKKKSSRGFLNKIALERIFRLFELAVDNFEKKPELSDYYAKLAWKIVLRHKTGMPLLLKAFFCRKGKHFLMPGKTGEIERKKDLDNGLILAKIKCIRCNYERLTKIQLKDQD